MFKVRLVKKLETLKLLLPALAFRCVRLCPCSAFSLKDQAVEFSSNKRVTDFRRFRTSFEMSAISNSSTQQNNHNRRCINRKSRTVGLCDRRFLLASRATHTTNSVTSSTFEALSMLVDTRSNTVQCLPDHRFLFWGFAILGAFAKLQKATIAASWPSVCPSVRMQLGSHWPDFHEI